MRCWWRGGFATFIEVSGEVLPPSAVLAAAADALTMAAWWGGCWRGSDCYRKQGGRWGNSRRRRWGSNCCRWRWRSNERSTGEVIITLPTKRILEAARKRYNESLHKLTEVKARTCLTGSQFYVRKVEVSKLESVGTNLITYKS